MPARCQARRLVLIALLLSVRIVAAPEPPTTLPTMEVRENPLGAWGFWWVTRVSLVNKLTGNHAPPKTPYQICLVHHGSPAARAGVVLGDQLVAVDGVAFSRLNVSDFIEQFSHSESGRTLRLLLEHPVTHAQRTVEMTLDSGRRWRAPDAFALLAWGVTVQGVHHLHAGITHHEPAWVAGLRPLRAWTITWAGRSLTLIERPGEGVELREGDYTRPKAPKGKARPQPATIEDLPLPPCLGQLLPEGTTLTLTPEGTFTLEAPTSPETPTPTS